MTRVGAVLFRLPHLVGVAVVGRDEGLAADLVDGGEEDAEAAVDRFAGLADRGEVAGVADHVRVGVVDDDEAVLAGEDRGLGHLGHVRGRHLGLLVIGRDFLRALGHAAFFAGEGFLAVVVEEEGHVRELLGLRRAVLRDALLGDPLAEDVHHLGGLVEDDVRAEALLVVREGGVEDLEQLRAGEALELRIDEGAGDLAGAVAAEVEEQHRVAVLDEGRALDAGGRDELVADGVGVGRLVVIGLHGGGGRGGFRGRGAGEGVVGGLHAFPAVVAVHGPEAAGDAGDLADADLHEFGFELLEVAEAGGGRAVAAVHEGVHVDLGEAFFLQEAEEGVEVRQGGVDAGFGAEAHQVDRAAGGLDVLDEAAEGLDLAHGGRIGEALVDADDLLVDDAAGADVLVADFGIAHDADRQADIEAVGHDLGAGPVLGEAARYREVRQLHGVELVMLGVVVFAPTVADHQKYGFHKWIGARDRVI